MLEGTCLAHGRSHTECMIDWAFEFGRHGDVGLVHGGFDPDHTDQRCDRGPIYVSASQY